MLQKLHFFTLALVIIILSACSPTRTLTNTTFIETSPIKDQKSTNQCWSFCTTSFLEAEALRLGFEVPEISSFFYVYHTYLENAEYYLKKGRGSYLLDINGDLSFSVFEVFKDHGMVPEDVYDGGLKKVKSNVQLMIREHNEKVMHKQIRTKLDSILKGDFVMEEALSLIEAVLNRSMGRVPEEFTYGGKEITTNRFAEEYLPLDLDNYVAITSYVHLPFHENVLLEIPANWRQKLYYNLPIEEFMTIADKALLNGYTMVWSGDIGFDGGFNNDGFVIVKGEYQSEEKIGQWHRQSAFDRKTTQDDHGMHLVGLTYNKKGEKYYILKNSWGESYGFKGIWYLSENYFRLRTISLTAHRDVLDLGE